MLRIVRLARLLSLFSLIFVLTMSAAVADSPLTSTPFHEAYNDVKQVKMIQRGGKISKKDISWLRDQDVPLDYRLAYLNKLSWNIDGCSYSQDLAEGWWGKKMPKASEMRWDLATLYGYRLALDDYFDVADAQEYLFEALEERPSDIRVHTICRLIYCQRLLDLGDWDPIGDQFKELDEVIRASTYKKGMWRKDAWDSIYEYMSLYQS